jgi:hypothetical protein
MRSRPNASRFLRLIGLGFVNGVLLVLISVLTLWAVGALFIMFPINEFRGLAAAIYTLAVPVILVGVRPFWKGVVTTFGLFLLVLACRL